MCLIFFNKKISFLKLPTYLLILINLFNSILKDKEVLDLESVQKFHGMMRSKMLDLGGLQLGLCLLHRISFPSITISESKVSLYSLFL